MKTLYDILTPNLTESAPTPEESEQNAGKGTSDNALYYRMGRFKFDWKSRSETKQFQSVIDKYNIRGSNARKGIVDWQKDVAYPLCPDELECIHRKDWELDILEGVSEDALNHPHYDLWWDYIYNHHKPRHKILTVFECSNQKPYCYVGSLRYYAHRWNDYSDFASMDYGIQQWEFVNMYPSRWDEWDHYKEDSRMQYLYAEKTKERILEYHKNFPQYDKIIFICQNDHPQRPVNELWEDNTNKFRDWAVILTDDEFRKGARRANPDMGMGIFIQRTLNFDYTHKKYADLLASLYSNKEDKEEIKRRVHMSSRELESEGLYNIYAPEVAKEAYKHGVFPFDEKFMNEYKKNFKPSNKQEDDE